MTTRRYLIGPRKYVHAKAPYVRTKYERPRSRRWYYGSVCGNTDRDSGEKGSRVTHTTRVQVIGMLAYSAL